MTHLAVSCRSKLTCINTLLVPTVVIHAGTSQCWWQLFLVPSPWTKAIENRWHIRSCSTSSITAMDSIYSSAITPPLYLYWTWWFICFKMPQSIKYWWSEKLQYCSSTYGMNTLAEQNVFAFTVHEIQAQFSVLTNISVRYIPFWARHQGWWIANNG